MKSSMMRVRNVTNRGARGAVVATALMAAAWPLGGQAQALRGQVGAPPPAAAAPAPDAAAPPAPAPAFTPMRPMSESVAAIVNDEIISTYDLAQRMRLLIATTGVQPTRTPCPSSSNRPWSPWSTSGCSCRS